MILIVDNYDSFVHNLARYFRQQGSQTCVVRNDAIDVAAHAGGQDVNPAQRAAGTLARNVVDTQVGAALMGIFHDPDVGTAVATRRIDVAQFRSAA